MIWGWGCYGRFPPVPLPDYAEIMRGEVAPESISSASLEWELPPNNRVACTGIDCPSPMP